MRSGITVSICNVRSMHREQAIPFKAGSFHEPYSKLTQELKA
jgi:hypothetical protein